MPTPEPPAAPDGDYLAEFPEERARPTEKAIDADKDWMSEFPDESEPPNKERRRYPRRTTSALFAALARTTKLVP
jgi:hypothetical protein